MPGRLLPIALAMLLTSGLLAACTATRLTDSYLDSDYRGGPLESVLVIGLTEELRRRRIFEDTLSTKLADRGVRAVASASVATGQEDLTRDKIRDKARELGIQAVLVTRLIGVDRQTVYLSGNRYVVPQRYYYRFPSYYEQAYGEVYGPGYLQEYEIVSLETNLYDVAREQLVWSVISESFEPGSTKQAVDELSNLIVSALAEKGLVK